MRARFFTILATAAFSLAAFASSARAEGFLGVVNQYWQPAHDWGVAHGVNSEAILMFTIFVLFTLGITKWAASRTKSAADFYAAGGGITGFQNGLAIAGTTCPQPRSSEFPVWCSSRASTG
jgi:hypothetical protein